CARSKGYSATDRFDVW
nr:immunoglobulin heavy chain junction region [Macaca mulatta]